jgi:hypothetical protein
MLKISCCHPDRRQLLIECVLPSNIGDVIALLELIPPGHIIAAPEEGRVSFRCVVLFVRVSHHRFSPFCNFCSFAFLCDQVAIPVRVTRQLLSLPLLSLFSNSNTSSSHIL